jgi:hypothetical protein
MMQILYSTFIIYLFIMVSIMISVLRDLNKSKGK